MDNLIERLRNNRHPNGLKAQAATAIETLLAENSMLRKMQPVELSGESARAFELALEVSKLRADLARVAAERDAAVEDLRKHRKHKCDCCYYADKQSRFPCSDCQSPISTYGDGWKWRGIKKED